MKFPVDNLGKYGLNTDISSVSLPPQVWTEIINGRCEDQGIQPGITWQLWTNDVPNTNPIWLMNTVRQDTPYLMIGGDSDIYLYDGSSYIQVNQTIPNAPLQYRWSGVFDGEIPYVNSFADAPQYADYPDPNYLTTPTLKDVVYDPNGTAGNQTFRELGIRVRTLRAHKGFLFALGMFKDGQDRPSLVAWDDPTQSNVASGNWVAGPTTLAGEYDCVDSGDSGRIVDGLKLRDDFVIYKENTAWIARNTGLTQPAWAIKKLIGIPGLIAQDCVIEEKGIHYVWGPDDIYMHQGQNATSIVKDKVRKTFISLINPEYYQNCFVVKDVEKKEIWFCGPTGSAQYPNRALVYHWIDQTFVVNDLPEDPFITIGSRTTPKLTWGAASFSWESATFPWGQRNFSALDKAIIGVKGTALKQYDVGNTRWIDGTDQAFTTRFERIGVPFGGLNRQNMIQEIVISATGTGTIEVWAGSQQTPSGSVNWRGPRTFDVKNNRKVRIRTATGQYNAWRIQGSTGTTWRISDMEIIHEPRGDR